MKWNEWRGSFDGRPTMWIKNLIAFKGYKVDLHKFVARGDPDCFHSHPAKALRVVLWGGYEEEELYNPPWTFKHKRSVGHIGIVKPEWTHRISKLLNGKVSYSLWIRWPKTHKVKLAGDGWHKPQQRSAMQDLFEISHANISPCGTYRYWLERKWSEATPQTFVMLNPSTADANEDDPTIRRCISFAKREGAGGIVVVNLFALRATDPKKLDNHGNAIGGENTQAIGLALIGSLIDHRPVICAWGANKHASDQAEILKQRAKDSDVKLVCLGLTKSGAPKHPLYRNAP